MLINKLIISFGLGLFLVSCGGLPPAQPSQQASKPVQPQKITKAATDMQAQLDQAWQSLKNIKADEYTPKDFASSKNQYEKATAALRANFETGQPIASNTLTALSKHHDQLLARLDKITKLRDSAKEALNAAEKGETHIWVPDQLQEASDAYLKGMIALKKKELDASEELWTQSLFQAQSALAKARKERERKQAEDLMLETMKKLEQASQDSSTTPKGQVNPSSQWDGQKELNTLRKNSTSLLIPKDGKVVVLGEKSQITYLDEAKNAWRKGIEAMNTEDYALANQYFLQSQKLVEAYLALSIDKTYAVRLIPDRRECLWRIAENIYNDPFEWPRIWLRNKKLIQNPDVIYPGWVLIIPAR